MNNNIQRLTRLAILAALSLVILFLGTVLPSAKLTCIAISGIFVAAALLHYGYAWSASVYVITSLLSLLLFPSKTCAILYASFFGFYPLCKAFLESKLKKKSLCWCAKISLFCIIFWTWWLLLWGWWLTPGSYAVNSIFTRWYIFWPCCIIAFGIYDICFSILIQFYLQKFSRYFQ